MKASKVLMAVVTLGLIASVCIAPASASVLDDIGSWWNNVWTPNTEIPNGVSGSHVKVYTLSMCIDESTTIKEAVDKIVKDTSSTSMQKLEAIEVACGKTPDLEQRMAALQERQNAAMEHVTEDGEMPEPYELTSEDKALLEEYNQYLRNFAEQYRPTGGFGDPIN